MRRIIACYSLRELWQRICGIISDKSASLKLDGDLPDTKQSEIKIGKTLYIVNSRYNGKENIIDKFKRLITRKLESQSKET